MSPNRILCRGTVGVVLPTSCLQQADLYEVSRGTATNPKALITACESMCFVDQNDELYCLGTNAHTQLGVVGSDACGPHPVHGFARYTSTPARVLGPNGQPLTVSVVALGRSNTVVYTKNKELYGWGWATQGQTGDAPDAEVPSPTPSCMYGLCTTPRRIQPPPFP